MLRGLWRPSASSDPAEDGELKAYWAAYGGLRAIWHSMYFWVAVVAMVVLRPLWCSGDWTGLGMDLLPSLLGFSIGALAIMLALPGMKVFGAIADGGAQDSPFMEMASRLVHFIVVQVVALAVLFVAKAYPSGWTNGIGFLLLAYALFSAIAAALSLFGVARALNFSAPPNL